MTDSMWERRGNRRAEAARSHPIRLLLREAFDQLARSERLVSRPASEIQVARWRYILAAPRKRCGYSHVSNARTTRTAAMTMNATTACRRCDGPSASRPRILPLVVSEYEKPSIPPPKFIRRIRTARPVGLLVTGVCSGPTGRKG